MPAVIVVIALAMIGAGLIVAGSYLLAGMGVAFLVGGTLMFAAAALVRSGITANG